jgi:hypothetical protein
VARDARISIPNQSHCYLFCCTGPVVENNRSQLRSGLMALVPSSLRRGSSTTERDSEGSSTKGDSQVTLRRQYSRSDSVRDPYWSQSHTSSSPHPSHSPARGSHSNSFSTGAAAGEFDRQSTQLSSSSVSPQGLTATTTTSTLVQISSQSPATTAPGGASFSDQYSSTRGGSPGSQGPLQVPMSSTEYWGVGDSTPSTTSAAPPIGSTTNRQLLFKVVDQKQVQDLHVMEQVLPVVPQRPPSVSWETFEKLLPADGSVESWRERAELAQQAATAAAAAAQRAAAYNAACASAASRAAAASERAAAAAIAAQVRCRDLEGSVCPDEGQGQAPQALGIGPATSFLVLVLQQ